MKPVGSDRNCLAAIRAVANMPQATGGGTVSGELESLPSKDLMRRVTRDALYQQWVGKFLEDGQSPD